MISVQASFAPISLGYENIGTEQIFTAESGVGAWEASHRLSHHLYVWSWRAVLELVYYAKSDGA